MIVIGGKAIFMNIFQIGAIVKGTQLFNALKIMILNDCPPFDRECKIRAVIEAVSAEKFCKRKFTKWPDNLAMMVHLKFLNFPHI